MREEQAQVLKSEKGVKIGMPRLKSRPAGLNPFIVNVMIRSLGEPNKYHPPSLSLKLTES